MYPGTLFAEVSDLYHIWVETFAFGGFTESRLVHSWRTRTDYDARKPVFPYCLFNELLSVFGTHILIVGGVYDARFGFDDFRKPLNVYGRRDIAAAPTNEYSDLLHYRLP